MTSPFTRLVQALDYPMFIVTAVSPAGERAGCLVGFASQVSIKPPRFLVCLSKLNRTSDVARTARVLVVHAVGTDDRELAELFGGESGDEVDKFTRCAWHDGPHGTPVLDGVAEWFAGRVLDRVDFGDHVGHLLEPIEGEADDRAPNIGYQRVKDVDPGHAP